MTTQVILDGNNLPQTLAIFVPGVAGTASPDFQSVQGGTGMTPIVTDNSGVNQPVIGLSNVVTASTITRPADTTPYAVGDLIANNTTAGSVTYNATTLARANDKPVAIRRVRLYKSTTSTTNAQFRIHMFRVLPAVTNGDNGALSTTSTSDKIGYVDIDMTKDTTGNDGAYGIGATDVGSEILCLPTSGTATIYFLIEARGAYTPGNAETFIVKFEIFKD